MIAQVRCSLACVLDLVAEVAAYVVRVHVWALRHAVGGRNASDGPPPPPLLVNEVADD
jgi:hypothetical protein